MSQSNKPSNRALVQRFPFVFSLAIVLASFLHPENPRSRSIANAQEAAIGVSEGMPVVDWTKARDVVGRTAVVGGLVVDIGATKDGGIHFINFSKTDRSAFTLVIKKDRIEHFPKDLKAAYLNKLITVRGPVTLFKDNPQIVLSSADQISIVDRLPEASVPPPAVDVKVGDQIKIAAFNVRNLFDNVDDPYSNDETTPEKPRDELVKIAMVLREINADVIAFEEIESRGYLKKFLDVFVPELGYKDIVHFEGNDLRGIDVCLASRVPIGRVVSHRHLTFPSVDGSKTQRFSRDILRIELLPEGGDAFEVWALHLKSNSGGREVSEPIRMAECIELQKLLAQRLQQNPNANVIVMGDFNDTLDSPTLKTIMGTDLPNGALLQSLADPSMLASQITYTEEPYRSMIDFILVSKGMAQRYVPGSYAIRSSSLAESGSDHNPVIARFYKKAPARNVSSSVSRPN